MSTEPIRILALGASRDPHSHWSWYLKHSKSSGHPNSWYGYGHRAPPLQDRIDRYDSDGRSGSRPYYWDYISDSRDSPYSHPGLRQLKTTLGRCMAHGASAASGMPCALAACTQADELRRVPSTSRNDATFWRAIQQYRKTPGHEYGKGSFTIDGDRAVLVCLFPSTIHITSNILWVPLDRRVYLDKRRFIVRTDGSRSELIIDPFIPSKDFGVYRCLANSNIGGGVIEDVYQDTEFFSDDYWKRKPIIGHEDRGRHPTVLPPRPLTPPRPLPPPPGPPYVDLHHEIPRPFYPGVYRGTYIPPPNDLSTSTFLAAGDYRGPSDTAGYGRPYEHHGGRRYGDRYNDRLPGHSGTKPFPTITPYLPGDRYRPGEDLFRPNGERYRPSEDRYRPSDDRYRPSDDRYRPSEDKYRPTVDRYRPTTEDRYRPATEDRYRPMEDSYRPIQDRYPATDDRLRPLGERYKPQEEHYNSGDTYRHRDRDQHKKSFGSGEVRPAIDESLSPPGTILSNDVYTPTEPSSTSPPPLTTPSPSLPTLRPSPNSPLLRPTGGPNGPRDVPEWLKDYPYIQGNRNQRDTDLDSVPGA
ncbi:unnamed protein product [Cyprideis torosa]|uniref:Uncharacterized protein n=1 Tax=Cyprideis torosa TaxID=163714 RepID=A0A7R8W833_9CRUS|nr:unnamed protein product [Cyprideis torosa]CAG0883368.1 unnamed protein product [Cyprideis torosa]